MGSWPKPKDPDAVLDYKFDWSEWLQDGETIVESVFIVANSPTLELFDETIQGGFTGFWARLGEAGDVARITNRITSSAGRVDDDTSVLRIRGN